MKFPVCTRFLCGTRYIIYTDHDLRGDEFFNISAHEVQNPSRMKFFIHSFQVSAKIYPKNSDRIEKGRREKQRFLAIVARIRFERF